MILNIEHIDKNKSITNLNIDEFLREIENNEKFKNFIISQLKDNDNLYLKKEILELKVFNRKLLNRLNLVEISVMIAILIMLITYFLQL